MAKKRRKKAAARATKSAKVTAKRTSAKTKAAIAKTRRKVAAPKPSRPVAAKKPERKPIAKPRPESFAKKVAHAFTAVVDTLTDAERLHHKLDPGVSPEPE